MSTLGVIFALFVLLLIGLVWLALWIGPPGPRTCCECHKPMKPSEQVDVCQPCYYRGQR